MAKLRLGVIGAGSWAVASHLPNLQRHSDEIEFVIVNRPDSLQLQNIQQQFGFAHASTDWQDVVAAELDIVVISSPPAYHYDQAKAALISGAHVLCEKPFTLAAKDAWDLASTVRRTDRSLFVAFGWNYRPMVVEAYRLMQDCALGEIEHVMLHMESSTRELLLGTGAYADAHPDFAPQASTWSRAATSGGGYGQAQLTHILGVALWLTDLRGLDVFALMSTPAGAEVELHDAVAMRFTSGAIGTMSGVSAHFGKADNRHLVEIRVIGSRGMVHVNLLNNTLSHYRSGSDEAKVPLSVDAGLYDCTGPVEALIVAGLGGNVINNSPAELGARTVEILEACYQSALLESSVRIVGAERG